MIDPISPLPESHLLETRSDIIDPTSESLPPESHLLETRGDMIDSTSLPPESHLPLPGTRSNMIDPRKAQASTPCGQPELQPGSNPPHYEAKYYSIEDFDIVSHDPHLNADGSFFSIELEYSLKIHSIP